MKVSVIICTYNRADLLRKTLRSMTQLAIPDGVEWRLLVVNNKSTDHTEAVIDEFVDELPLTRHRESKQGLSHARNCGLAAATGDLILFTDDDVQVEADWLTCYVDAAVKNADCAFFGGPVEPWFEETPPKIMLDAFEPLATGFCGIDLGPAFRVHPGEEIPFKGANFGFRPTLASGLEFNPDFGVRGGDWLGNEETAFLSEIALRGGIGLWVHEASVRHWVPAARCTLDELRKFYRGLGRTIVRKGELADGPKLFGVPRWILREYAGTKARTFVGSLKPASVLRYRDLARLWQLEGIIAECRSGSPSHSSTR